jgi:bifunctional non-homologous end joining protein LigD
VRLAAQAVAREVERRAPDLATSRWWKEERQGVFVDFNQNAKDRTVASAWSVRATPDARVSMPVHWDEVRDLRPEAFTLVTAPERHAAGDPWAGMDAERGTLDGLLALAERLGPVEKPPKGAGRRTATRPLVEVARARTRAEALAGLDAWKAKHPDVVPLLEEADVLVDGMRGSSSLWYRVRVNLEHVPEPQRPEQAELEVDYDPWAGYRGAQRPPVRR